MPLYRNRFGHFCSGASKKRLSRISEVNQKRWKAYRCSELKAITGADHQYAKKETSKQLDENIPSEGVDVVEQVIPSTHDLPKNVISVGKIRLIIELQHVINQLKEGCLNCKLPLNICSSKGVQTRGLGGWIYVICDNPACLRMNKISMGKQHRDQTVKNSTQHPVLPSGNAIFDINTKVASGMLHSGIGETHVNNLFTTMNLPQISHASLKKRENEIGLVLETFAKESADSALATEKELAEKSLEMHGIEVC